MRIKSILEFLSAHSNWIQNVEQVTRNNFCLGELGSTYVEAAMSKHTRTISNVGIAVSFAVEWNTSQH
jgi:hypothetical protein